MKSFRRFCCRWFSMHKPELYMRLPREAYDIHRCVYCGMESALHWHTRQVFILRPDQTLGGKI